MSSIYIADKLFIGNEWVAPVDGGVMESIDPSTGKVWAHAAFGGRADVDRAVAAASQAFRGPWSKLASWDRAEIIRRFADLYKAKAPDLAILESSDCGRPIRESRAEVGMHHQWYHYYAGKVQDIYGQTLPLDQHMLGFTNRLPVGVVGAIMPWNGPLLTLAWKLAPALAAGCTVVLKPAEHTPVSTLALGDLIKEAGFPAGVINILPGYGDVAGDHLVRHPDVHKIAFTGEGATATRILQSGADRLKRFSFELGGKAPHIIFDDADLANALNAATSSAWAMCGQSCALGSRLLVQDSIYERVVEELAKRAQKVRVGLALDEKTHMGPQTHDEQLAKTLSYIEIGQNEGARLVAGGSRIASADLAGGSFIQPTVFADVDNSMRIAQEEIFGPVLSVIPFSDEEQAVSIANDTRYGLTAGLWSNDIGRAHRVASQIRAGIVWVNTYRYIRWSTPYGGFNSSGWGRENGAEALNNYLETKTTILSTTGHFADSYAN